MIVINYENNEDYKVSKFPGGEILNRESFSDIRNRLNGK